MLAAWAVLIVWITKTLRLPYAKHGALLTTKMAEVTCSGGLFYGKYRRFPDVGAKISEHNRLVAKTAEHSCLRTKPSRDNICAENRVVELNAGVTSPVDQNKVTQFLA